ATRTRLTLVARRGHVLEVDAAGALEEIAAGGGGVAQLPGGAGEQCAGQHRVVAADARVRRQIAVADHRADADTAVVEILHGVQVEAVDVDDRVRGGDPQFEVVDQI